MKSIVTLFTIISIAFFSFVGADERSSTKSPLLGDYSSFRPDKEDKSNLVFRHKDKKAKDFKKFIVDPVLIYPSVHRGGERLSAENIQKLSELFRTLLSDALKSGYELTEDVGADTLRLRFGIRDLKPGGYYMDSSGTHEIKPDTELAAVTFEMEGIDSLTGERVVAIVRNVQKDDVKGADRDKQVQRVQDLFAEWVALLRRRLDQSNIPK